MRTRVRDRARSGDTPNDLEWIARARTLGRTDIDTLTYAGDRGEIGARKLRASTSARLWRVCAEPAPADIIVKVNRFNVCESMRATVIELSTVITYLCVCVCTHNIINRPYMSAMTSAPQSKAPIDGDSNDGALITMRCADIRLSFREFIGAPLHARHCGSIKSANNLQSNFCGVSTIFFAVVTRARERVCTLFWLFVCGCDNGCG